MGLTSALNTSLNGLTLNETSIDVLGNNIANAGTNGFKASSVLFTTQLSRTLSVGSRPTATNGGTNPRQIGLGAQVSAIVKDFTQGSITNSTSPSDLAIQGDGFFVLDGADGQVFTRNGNFNLDSTNRLTHATGGRVQGYGVDQNFNIVTTSLTDISIPVGDLNVAQQTTEVEVGGALLTSSNAAVATQGSELTSAALTDSATSGAITGATLLSNVQDALAASLFTVGETLTFAPKQGGSAVESQSLDVTATTTVDDLLGLMSDTIGIHSGGTIPNDGSTGTQPVVEVTAGGQIHIVGNMGTVNDIEIVPGQLTSDGATVDLGFVKNNTADGESALLRFVVFDSLGEAINMQLATVLESRTGSTTTYRYFLESPDDSRTSVAISDGTFVFDGNGNITVGGTMTAGQETFSIQRDDTAAISPMQVTLDVNNLSGISSATSGSNLNLFSQNGSDPGTLTSFTIDETGTINGVFDNGILRNLGQIVLARFRSPQGLLEAGNSMFTEGVSSGAPSITTPGTLGAGTIRSGSIELSNTDIGRNLVDLIVASTNYRGNARVISSVQQLVDELLVLGR